MYSFMNDINDYQMHKSNLQKHVTVSSTSNGKIIWPLAVRSCRPIDEYRTLDKAFDAAPLLALPTIVFSHITDDFSLFLLFRALHHHPFELFIVYVQVLLFVPISTIVIIPLVFLRFIFFFVLFVSHFET